MNKRTEVLPEHGEAGDVLQLIAPLASKSRESKAPMSKIMWHAYKLWQEKMGGQSYCPPNEYRPVDHWLELATMSVGALSSYPLADVMAAVERWEGENESC